ncbi:MAG: sigma-54-dependent Fis family transcriptional regulator [Bryobacteraceae bacterium]|nr:sigma-54-dependent Fis family transcriptional regulator [Bryobacteraceae bacterium]
MGVEAETFVFQGMEALVASKPLRQLMEYVRRIAAIDAAVLITGESGAGKEVIARALHHYSRRAAQPWVDVSCAALAENLIESELFGHEKGAFSGADSSKPGLFELAHRGTLFLDEIGELDPKMQVKLLRILDGVPYYRLGGVRKVSVDVRIVAATNQNLDALARAGRFRADLYHRLTQFHVQTPALRERKDDILPLAALFLREAFPATRFDDEAERALLAYSWPGNIRELRNTVLQSAVAARGSVIRKPDLPERVRSKAVGPDIHPVADPGDCSLDRQERRMILEALLHTGGHQQRAANLLGISRRTLSRKLKLYALQEASSRLTSPRVQ